MLEEWQTDNDFKRNATSYLFCFFCLKTSLIRKPLWMFTAALFLYFLSLLYVTFVLYNDTATHQMRKVLKSIKNKSQENKAWGMCCDTTYRILTQRFRTPAKIQFFGISLLESHVTSTCSDWSLRRDHSNLYTCLNPKIWLFANNYADGMSKR